MSRVGPVSEFVDLASVELMWFDKEFLFLPLQASYGSLTLLVYLVVPVYKRAFLNLNK